MLFNLVFSEITLKGKNRKDFQNSLIRNLRYSAGEIKSYSKGSRLILESENSRIKEILMDMFGIDYAYPCVSVKPDMQAIKDALSQKKFPGKSISVRTRRSEKSFPMTSQQVSAAVGQMLVEKGSTVNLRNPEVTVYIDILEDMALISFEKIKCPGGLPVGSSGRVLSLFSGGIDSPVSSWLMMRRGCMADLLHLHSLRSNGEVSQSKIMGIAKHLKRYHPPKLRLFAAPYDEFYKKSMLLGSRNELVVFRRFLLRLGNRLAEKYHYKALVTGDSLAQVASQTLENISTTSEASELPVLRPLIAYSKQEIVDLSIRLGLYENSVAPYKDCCSLVAHKSPSTKVKPEDAKRLEDEIGIEDIVDKTIDAMDVIEL